MSQPGLLEQWQRWLAPEESAAALFSRVRLDPLQTGLALFDGMCPSPLRPGQIVEVTGPAASGKTEVLVQVRGWRRGWLWPQLRHAARRPPGPGSPQFPSPPATPTPDRCAQHPGQGSRGPRRSEGGAGTTLLWDRSGTGPAAGFLPRVLTERGP